MVSPVYPSNETPPSHDYPNDADGDALRRLAAAGDDMDAPMTIEFPVVVPDEASAQRFKVVAAMHGFDVRLWKHDDDSDWDVVCSVSMIPNYTEVVRIQQELTELAKPYSGCCDSWGTWGNRPENQPKKP